MKNIIFLLTIILFLVGCDYEQKTRYEPTTPFNYSIEVAGTVTTANITFTNKDGGIEQHTNYTLPFTYDFPTGKVNITVKAESLENTNSVLIINILNNDTIIRHIESQGPLCVAEFK